ncbi:MAG: TonB-dependent receptor [Pseudomonadota bacterium]
MTRHCRLTLPSLLLPLFAQAAATADNAAPSGPLEVVTIFGQGQTRQVHTLARDDLQQALPGSSPLKTLEKVPGVSFQASDPFGSYELSTHFSIRGFSQNQLGFTLDGVPLGDMTYGPNSGLPVSRAISSDNIGRVAVSQGAGTLATASTSNLGGTVQFFSLAPSDTAGASANVTVGSAHTRRSFVRLDSGLLESGVKAYLSATRQRTDKSKGWGEQNLDQFNARLRYAAPGLRLDAFVNTADRHEVDYADLSLEMVRRLGYGWDNYAPDWQRAVDAANGRYSGGVTNADDAYFLGRGLRRDTLAGATLDLETGRTGALKTTLYHHDNKGQGHWYTPYQRSPSGVPIAIRTTEYSIDRNGAIVDWSYEIGRHTVSAGAWGERSRHGLRRNFYNVDGPQDSDRFLSDPFLTLFRQEFVTTTRQFYLADTMTLDKLTLDAGFKAPRTHIVARSLEGTRAAGTLTAAQAFLPQAGANYRFSRADEIFLSLAKNMRAYLPGNNGPFSASQAAFDAGAARLQPETSVTADLGYRFRRAQVQGSISVYHAAFDNRQLSVANCIGIANCPSTFVNVGKVETSGIEAAAAWKPAPAWSWFNAATYNDSRYRSDYLDADSPVRDAAGNGVVRAAGKRVVDNARVLFNSELSFERAGWFGRASAHFTGKRYYTYLNDASVPAFWLASLGAGYRLASSGVFREVTIQLNVGNLFDKRYFSTVGTNGFRNTDPDGSFATLLSGAPRQVFISLGGKI